MGENHTKKRRHSKFFSFPAEIQQQIKDLILEPSATYEDVVLFLDSKGYKWSTSSVERFSKWFITEIRQIEILREQAGMLLNEPDKAMQLEKLTSQMITMRLAVAMQTESFDVLKHAKMIDAFAKLQQSSMKREQWGVEIRDKIAAAAGKVEKIGKAKGLTKETVELIKKQILGIA
jgi:hypothetical protein